MQNLKTPFWLILPIHFCLEEEPRVKQKPDLVLVVEDENFHVHRLILSLNSPVFKAMFKLQFKESTANEIPLP